MDGGRILTSSGIVVICTFGILSCVNIASFSKLCRLMRGIYQVMWKSMSSRKNNLRTCCPMCTLISPYLAALDNPIGTHGNTKPRASFSGRRFWKHDAVQVVQCVDLLAYCERPSLRTILLNVCSGSVQSKYEPSPSADMMKSTGLTERDPRRWLQTV